MVRDKRGDSGTLVYLRVNWSVPRARACNNLRRVRPRKSLPWNHLEVNYPRTLGLVQ